ncbi:uncharacterized protein AC631_04248 [Debaryomyces fabryi]|uniref:[acyl-carrier-protein] S-malonyltransferase n=1 Tax=Debaryomyces fabryi TaxID=58627 RepID=A0A0V1PUQ7_9ASCO|nr:uncharacterized protein AC631_04248 [Debaryomyces fabryi]KRZ99990.1 hypothetical protein AC631_04248 [Debaryomyces fabryi]CUM54715.1 unnamed protein product [Debaryomyces fabryi]
MYKSAAKFSKGLRIDSKWLSSTSKVSGYAITCPGQGIIKDGLLVPYAKFQHHFQESLEIIDESLNEKFSEKLLNNQDGFGKQWLIHTSNAQPAILATTYIICEIVRKEYGIDLPRNEKVQFLLGHSLGEYTALLLSGVLDLTGAIKLVRERGRLMEELVSSDDYSMVALMFKPSYFSEIMLKSKEMEVLANVNSYQQIVLSGKLSKIDETIKAINNESKKILKTVKLPVKIPFHNSILHEIEPKLLQLATPIQKPTKPIISNLQGEVSADPLLSTIRANSQPVQWTKSMEYLVRNNITDIINLGPGDVLKGLNSKFKVRNHSVESVESMNELRNLF